MQKQIILVLGLFFISHSIATQNQRSGVVIKPEGTFFEVPNPTYKTNLNSTFKVVFDIGRQTGKENQINALLNTPARFLNMHVQAGVPKKNISLALVVHGAAIFDVLSNSAYLKKYGVSNPNSNLITSLQKAGAQIIVCGQTAAYQNIQATQLHSEIKIALSAMTALTQLQTKHYSLIQF